jgi:hypothetical protein
VSETETERLEPERTETTEVPATPEVAEAAAEEPVIEETAAEEAAVAEAVAQETAAAAEPEVEETTAETTEPAATAEEALVEETAAVVAEPTEVADVAEAAESTTEPAPAPVAVPKPSALPRPPRPRPVPRAAAAPAPVVTPPPTDLTPEEAVEAAGFGRVDEEGTVWVREAAGERAVGQFPGGDPVEAVALYVRRYGDLRSKVLLLEQRLATDAPKDVEQAVEALVGELAEPAAVGDLDALRARLESLRAVAVERKAHADAERAAAKAAAIEARTALVDEAEKIAGVDPSRMQWRPAGEQLRILLDQWKDAQRNGPRIDRPTEDALWKRFSHARSTFDRERRRFFADLEKANSAAKDAKAAIVAQAEALATSTDWAATASAYRDLMDRWKSAGRAGRKDDDALWARFRAAQDAFFAAREAQNKATDAEFSANLEVKLGLLAKAEALLPVKDLAAAKAALRDLQDAWEKAGKVPRADVQRVEGRLRAVEQAVRDADQANWRRTNPETRARAEGAAAQLHAAIAALEADLDKATASGDAKRIADATAALAARRSWLEQVEKAAAESR